MAEDDSRLRYRRFAREAGRRISVRDFTARWQDLTSLDATSPETRCKAEAFCTTKRITFEALDAIGTRVAVRRRTEWFAWAFRDHRGRITAIKYRGIESAIRENEPGSTFLRPGIIGDPTALDWFVAEGETDAARLFGLVGDVAAILWLPAGAAFFPREWADFIPRGAVTHSAHDADQAGDDGASLVAAVVRRHVRVRPPDRANDWCEWAGDREQFIRLVSAARETAGTTGAGWLPPIALGSRPLPPFPLQALPPVLADYVAAEATATQTPPDLAAMLVFGTLAILLASRVDVEVMPGWIEPVNLFILVILPSGERKSAVFRDVLRPVHDLERRHAAAARPTHSNALARRQIGEKRAKHLADLAARATAEHTVDAEAAALHAAEEAEAIHIPPIPRLIADDATPEAAVSLLSDHGGRMGFASPEGGFFDGLCRYQQGGIANQDALLKAYSGDPIRVDRKGRPPETIDRPLATLALTAQPYVLERIDARGDFRGKGLLARLLFALPTSVVGSRDIRPECVPSTIAEQYAALIRDLDRVDTDSPLHLTTAAASTLDAFRAALEPRLGPAGNLAEIADWGNKLPGVCVRLAGLLHMARNGALGVSDLVSHETMSAALAIGDYLLEHAQAAFNLVGIDAAVVGARRVWAWINREQCTSFQARDAFEGVKGTLKTMDRLEAALRTLEHHHYVRQQPAHHKGPGRPQSPTYLVNPCLSSHYSQNPTVQPPFANTANRSDFADLGPFPHDASAETNERAFLAELDRLVASGCATWGDMPSGVSQIHAGDANELPGRTVLCAFPAHRPYDWRTQAGRWVCGVCHPSASPHLLLDRRS